MKLLFVETGHAPSLRITEEKYKNLQYKQVDISKSVKASLFFPHRHRKSPARCHPQLQHTLRSDRFLCNGVSLRVVALSRHTTGILGIGINRGLVFHTRFQEIQLNLHLAGVLVCRDAPWHVSTESGMA